MLLNDQPNLDNLPLNSRTWKRMERITKSSDVSVKRQSFEKRSVDAMEYNQVKLPSKRLQVSTSDKKKSLILAKADVQLCQEP